MKKPFSPTLRFRITLGVALPMLLGFGGLSLLQYAREEAVIRNEMQNWAINVGDIMISTLKHAMATHDREEVDRTIENTANTAGIMNVRLVDSNFTVQAVNDTSGLRGSVLNTSDTGCIECHKFPTGSRPRAMSVISPQSGVLRVANPIKNEPECTACHDAMKKHIGVLLIDVSEAGQRQSAQNAAILNLLLSLLVTLLVSLWIYFNINRLIAPRVEAFRGPLDDYANGEFSVRLPVSPHHDEIDAVAQTFNDLAEKLEDHIEARKQHGALLQRTIIEERERIARELHDSLPQLLAYLTTKIGAVRLFLEHGKRDEALENLGQLEAASRDLINDVREAIIGLRMSRRITEGLVPAVRGYIDRFTQFCGLPVEFETNADAPDDTQEIDPETQIHVLRIVQEALSNIRKHAGASKATVDLNFGAGMLVLMVRDNGRGFDIDSDRETGIAQFGLHTMRERAESVDGAFDIASAPGRGTTITVTLMTHSVKGN